MLRPFGVSGSIITLMANRCCLFAAAAAKSDTIQCECGQQFQKTGITTIRANRIFSLVEERGPERIAHVRLPLRRERDTEDYSLKLLETHLLIALMRITKARRVFEFGTFMGNTATNLALNAKPGVMIHTVDLNSWQHPETARLLDHVPIDFRNSHIGMEWGPFPEVQARHISALLGDSTKLDLTPYFGLTDLVWLDGGRDRRTVESDAANAFQMLPTDRLGVIGWHDYQHPDCGELNAFLEELAGRVPLYHIQDTAMLLYFNQPMWEKLR